MARRNKRKKGRMKREDSPRSKKRGRSRGRKKSSGFQYERRSAKKWKERAEQSGYSHRSMFVEDVKVYRPKEGDNLLRILPPTFEDADHYGFEIFVHYGIGPDNDAFLDLSKMQNEADPIVEERSRALKDNDKDYADKLQSKKRVLVYLIDRDDEEAGLQVWSMPWTLDADVTTLAVDKRTGEVLDIDDPEDGYDIEFTKKGKGINTQYVGVAIARSSSPLDSDDALDEAMERPLPECLKYYEHGEIQKVFDAGGGAYDDDDEEDDDDDDNDDDDDRSGRSSRGGRRGKKDKGRSRKRRKYDDDEDDEDEDEEEEEEEANEVTWGEVMAMDLDELLDLIEDESLDIDIADVEDEDEDEAEDLKAEVCDELGLKKPKKRSAKKSERKKLRKRGRKR